MVKVFIIHGFESTPNGGWRSWLMAELAKKRMYACALSMPDPATPVCSEWVAEISRHVERNADDKIYLVGHSLGVPAILRYLESAGEGRVSGAVLVSGRSEKTELTKLSSFFDPPFDLEKIRTKAAHFVVIHGDDDSIVPFRNAEILSKGLGCEPIIVHKGGHLGGKDGWHELPQCFEALVGMMN